MGNVDNRSPYVYGTKIDTKDINTAEGMLVEKMTQTKMACAYCKGGKTACSHELTHKHGYCSHAQDDENHKWHYLREK